MHKKHTIVVIGGGAAGFFGAITCAQANSSNSVILLEKARQVLSKVRVSGGGRCNVTHACFDPALLIQHYPRGGKALRGPFTRFQPRDTVRWFEEKGVQLKTEPDGRMFPVTDSSETIINCLTSAAKQSGVQLRTESDVKSIEKLEAGFAVELSGETLHCDRILFATGSNPKIYSLISALGHSVVPPVPSLFTFNIPNFALVDLSGISVPKVKLKIMETSLEQTGPLLITHWGFSGPAVLKLSAWGARTLHEMGYKAKLAINWLPDEAQEATRERLLSCKKTFSARFVSNEVPVGLPKNLWKKIAAACGIPDDLRWSDVSGKQLHALIEALHGDVYQIEGKSTYKEEFVTCGGVSLDEVDFKTMESRLCRGLFFSGEVLNIDGVTGGFNFQAAWTTAWVAGNAMSIIN